MQESPITTATASIIGWHSYCCEPRSVSRPLLQARFVGRNNGFEGHGNAHCSLPGSHTQMWLERLSNRSVLIAGRVFQRWRGLHGRRPANLAFTGRGRALGYSSQIPYADAPEGSPPAGADRQALEQSVHPRLTKCQSSSSDMTGPVNSGVSGAAPGL